jgi:hypothetical protein
MRVLFRIKKTNLEVRIPISYIVQFLKENSVKIEHD